jgi:hypothetical protein
MTAFVPTASRTALTIATLATFGALFSFGFACAIPFAAFAAIAAMGFERRTALVATGAVWFANQTIGFVFLHYPTDAETLAWGGALGVIALIACEAAGLVTRRVAGAVGAATAFFAAFFVYEGALLMIDAGLGRVGHMDVAGVLRIFFINACAFGAMLALKTIAASRRLARKRSDVLAPRSA